MVMVRSKYFRQKVASVAIVCSWPSSIRCPAFIARRWWSQQVEVLLRFLLWFDLHFEVVRRARHIVGPLVLHCRWIAEQAAALTIDPYGLFIGGEKQSMIAIPFPEPKNVHGRVLFRENTPVAILAVGSKRSVWATWTVMNNFLSQFAWPCAHLKESAICRVVKRQVGL